MSVLLCRLVTATACSCGICCKLCLNTLGYLANKLCVVWVVMLVWSACCSTRPYRSASGLLLATQLHEVFGTPVRHPQITQTPHSLDILTYQNRPLVRYHYLSVTHLSDTPLVGHPHLSNCPLVRYHYLSVTHLSDTPLVGHPHLSNCQLVRYHYLSVTRLSDTPLVGHPYLSNCPLVRYH